MTITEVTTPKKIEIRPIDHFTGARMTRRTWQAVVMWSDGTETACGHEQHPSTAAAVKCGRRVWRRGERLGSTPAANGVDA